MIIVNVIKKEEKNGHKGAMQIYELARCKTREDAQLIVENEIDEHANSFYFEEQAWREHTHLSLMTDCETYLTVYQFDFYDDEGSEDEIRHTWLYQYIDTESITKNYGCYSGFTDAVKAYRKEVN